MASLRAATVEEAGELGDQPRGDGGRRARRRRHVLPPDVDLAHASGLDLAHERGKSDVVPPALPAHGRLRIWLWENASHRGTGKVGSPMAHRSIQALDKDRGWCRDPKVGRGGEEGGGAAGSPIVQAAARPVRQVGALRPSAARCVLVAGHLRDPDRRHRHLQREQPSHGQCCRLDAPSFYSVRDHPYRIYGGASE